MGGNALVHFLGTADAALEHSRTLALAWLLVVLVVLSAAIGLGAAVSNRPELPGEPSDPGEYRVGDAAPATFGSVRVTDVGTLGGVTHGALAGATRGVKSYVDGAHATVRATLRVDNTSAHRSTLRVDQFRLRVTGGGKTLLRRPDGGNLSDTTLPEHSGLSGHLDFTIPRKGARLALVVTPAGPSGPVVIDLGRAAFGARAPGGPQH